MIQKLREKHQQYPSDLENDSENEHELEDRDIEKRKQLPTKNHFQQQSMKNRIDDFPIASNFDDTG